MELKTIRREDAAWLKLLRVERADTLKYQAKERVMQNVAYTWLVANILPGIGEDHEAASCALPGGPVGTQPSASEAEADCAELDAEREVLEAAAATQSFKMSQSSHLTELVPEGQGPPPLEEKPDASIAWEVQEPVPMHQSEVSQRASAGAEEIRPVTMQDAASSPAHSAVTTPATSGYQTLPKGVPDPVEIPACADPPAAVFTAEDEAVVGLKRRGGVEVVVESPRAKVNAHREPLSARSSQREGSEPRSEQHRLSPVPGSLGLQGAPAPMVPRQGRPPRQPATPGSAAGSMESEQPAPRRRVPSLGRRPSLPKADAARRSSSAGRSAAGLQPNRKLVRNALEKYCLKGEANREQREQVLRSFDQDLERFDRFIILFRSIHTGRHDLRALYGFAEGCWSRVLQILPSPASLEERMVVQCLRYDSGGKEFKEVPASQEPLSVADAVFLHPQFLQRSRVVVP
ncbi:Camsap2 [Symbiodinium pilosum]|uniref:Camsap2 protein n=1 Tax=Symbiodinium pilosum TaxID=2952 RepID=A0A812WIE4_SYMPI|nr:Camsap2 [Symbiodinium pilosum]